MRLFSETGNGILVWIKILKSVVMKYRIKL